MIALATLRHRWAAFAGTFLTLALGVALIASTLLVYLSATPQIPQRYAGTAVFVRTSGAPWTANALSDLTTKLSAVDGVTEVIPERTFYAQILRDGRPIGNPDRRDPQGHSWSTASLAPYPVLEGRAPTADRELVLGRTFGYPVGADVTLLTASGLSAYKIVGLIDGPGIYVSDRTAQRLAPGVSLVGVRGPADLEVDGANVLSGDERRLLEADSDAHTRWIGTQLLVAMVTLAGFAAVFVVASTFAFAANQRRREFGLLRAVGATPRQIRRMVYASALGVGVVASLAGVGLGSLLAPVLGAVLISIGFEPPGFSVQLSPLALAASYAGGVVVAVLGAGSASRRAGKVSPLEALRSAIVDRRPMTRLRYIVGAVFLLGGLLFGGLIAGADGEDIMLLSMASAMALVVGLTLFAPIVMPVLVRCVPGYLVRESALTAVRRTASTAAPVLVTVGFAALILGQVATIAEAYKGGGPSAIRSSAVVAPSGTPGLSDAVLAVLPASAHSLTPTLVWTPSGPVEAVGSSALSDPSTVVASTYSGLTVDTVLPVTFADGTTSSFRVSAIAPDGPALAFPRSVVRDHDPSALATAAFVDGVSVSALRSSVSALGATAVAGQDYESFDSARENRLVWVFVAVLIGMSLTYTGIAVANTLAMATADRRRDFAVLRLSGASVGQVLRMVGAEAMLVVGLGSVLGLAVALPALFGLRAGIADAMGTPVPLLIPWPYVGSVIGACLALALGASVLPAWLALRRRTVSVG